MSEGRDEPILVVGARTTGLSMASELARHGAAVRIVDRSKGIDPHCRATMLHSRTLEVFQDLGIVDAALAEGLPERGVHFFANGGRFLHTGFEGVDSPFPFGLGLPQSQTEALLEGHLERQGVRVERETELLAVSPRDDGVRATLRRADGREEVVDTPWLLGCDGAHSTIRHQVGEPFPGETDPHQYLLAHVREDSALPLDETHVFFTDRGALFFFVTPGGRRLVCADVPEPHDPAAEAPTLAQVQALVDDRGPGGVRLHDPAWLSYFRIHYRLARHYRRGRIFLAGDAVHIHSLIGGQGMNTGIQDAYNLGWKLALVATGRAPESLLESYEIERRRIADDVISATRSMTEPFELFAHMSVREREKLLANLVLPEAEQRRQARHNQEIDLDYRSSPICIEQGERFAGGPHAGAQAPDVPELVVDGGKRGLYELLRGTRHTLLVFGGVAPDASSREDVAPFAAAQARSLGDSVNVLLVDASPADRAPSAAPAIRVLDPEQALHRRYAAERPCVYLIRPDGYVGHRSQPLSDAGVRAYFARVLSPGPRARRNLAPG